MNIMTRNNKLSISLRKRMKKSRWLTMRKRKDLPRRMPTIL